MNTPDGCAARFWSKVRKTDGCWLWMGTVERKGYGIFAPTRLKNVRAHRLAYELCIGPVPVGKTLDHLCRIRRCVNPAHLEPVTNRENILRGVSFSASNARKTHCSKGHEYTPANTQRDKLGRRNCRICRARRCRERRARKRAYAALVAAVRKDGT